MAKILVVDDEESLLDTFGIFLSDEGHEVVTARSYDEALEHLSEADVVFSDIVLGRRTGIDLLSEVKARGLTCPVVMITGFPEVHTAAQAVRLGAFDYLAKPVVQAKLLQLANVALRYKEAIDEREKYRSHLEAIFRSVEDAIVTVDMDLTLLEANDAAGRLWGLGREAIGKNLADRGVSCERASGENGLLEALAETLEGRGPVRARRVECRREGGPALVLSVSTYPLAGNERKTQGAVLVARDETRLAVLEMDLDERRKFHRLIGKSDAMRKVYALVESLADVETTVLVTGESGTGKELVAEALHYQGARASGPLVKVNCSALPETLLESELFGHVKGAFTGAARDRVGRFERADGGTILLDEIGDTSERVQSRLLRVLQEKEIERVGDSRPVKVDVRVVASTNKNLADLVARGKFREDLYYRLKVVEIRMPPLRDRREDIPLLVAHFVGKFNGKLKKEIRGVSADVERFFLEYGWPGNVRQLEHVLEHAFILCRQDAICMEHLSPDLTTSSGSKISPPSDRGADARSILSALRMTAWNKARAARNLGIDRRTLYRKMAKYGIVDEIPE